MSQFDSPAFGAVARARGARHRMPAMPLELCAGVRWPSLSTAVKTVQRRLGIPQDGHLSPVVAVEFQRLGVVGGSGDASD